MSSNVVFVFGGTGNIGSSICLELLKLNYHVYFTWSSNIENKKSLLEESKKISDQYFLKPINYTFGDNTDFFFDFLELNKDNDISLVFNTGINGGRLDILDLSIDSFKQVLDVNVLMSFEFVKKFYNFIKSNNLSKRYNIIFISSQIASFGSPDLVSYCASKGAVNSMALALSKSFGHIPINVNVVSPGIIDNNYNLRLDIPLGRSGFPYEVANVVSFLLSRESSFINGAIIPVHGGR